MNYKIACEHIIDILKKRPNQKLSIKEIAEILKKDYKQDEKSLKPINGKPGENYQDKTCKQLSAEIQPDIREYIQKKCPNIKFEKIKTEEYGRKKIHGWYENTENNTKSVDISKTSNNNIEINKEVNNSPNIKEQELYSKLEEFLKSIKLEPKRIDEQTSSNTKGKNGNKWLHPDIVAYKKISDKWDRIIKECAKCFYYPIIRVFSFEVKNKINKSNVRECFFQTVSNSSWANESYLVTKDIDKNAKDEFKLLNNQYGIGLIELNYDNPKDSKITIPAIKRVHIDWSVTNRILQQNTCFKKFIEEIYDYLKAGYFHS